MIDEYLLYDFYKLNTESIASIGFARGWRQSVACFFFWCRPDNVFLKLY